MHINEHVEWVWPEIKLTDKEYYELFLKLNTKLFEERPEADEHKLEELQ